MKQATLIERWGRDLYQVGVRARIQLGRALGPTFGRESADDDWWRAGPRELPPLTRADWTPAGARLAMREADNGQLRLAAQLCQAIRGYGVASGVLSTRTHGMFRMPIKFSGPQELVTALRGTRTSYAAHDDVVETEVEGDFWRMFPEAELAKLTSWGILLGAGVGELVPPEEQSPPRRRGLGERYVPTLRTWESEWLRYDWTRRKWFLTTAQGEIEVTPGDGRWILYLPYGASNPWLHGAWRAAGLAYVLAQIAIYDRARHSEVLGSAARVGMAPKGASERQRERLRQQIKAMSRDNVFVMPEGWELRMVEAVGRTWDIYSDTIKWAEREIEIVLAGQTVTTEGNSGIGESDVWSDIKGDFIQFTAESLATTIHDQGVAPWAEINYGARDAAPWARWNLQRPKDRKALAEAAAAEADALAKLGAAITSSNEALQRAGSKKRIAVEQLLARYDVPLEAVSAPPPGAPPGLPPSPAPNDAADEAPPTEDAAAALAAKMTEHGVSRCEHGCLNRCRLCGVERVRDFVAGPDGPTWQVAWRPIESAPMALPEAS